MRIAISQYGVSACSRKWKRSMPTVISPRPITGNTL